MNKSEITWLKPKSAGRALSDADVSITKLKCGGISLVFRNNCYQKISNTAYIALGVTAHRIYFVDGFSNPGRYRLGINKGCLKNRYTRIDTKENATMLYPFIGNYDLQTDVDGARYVDRRLIK